MSTKSKFTIILVLTSLIGAFVFGLLSYLDSRSSLREAAFEELTAIRVARAQQVQEYFRSISDEASVVTENPTVRSAMVQYRDAFYALENDPALEAVDYLGELEAYYDRVVIPRLRHLFVKGVPEARGLMPRSNAGRYLQYRFIANNPHAYGDHDNLTVTSSLTEYEQAHRRMHNALKFIREEFNYYDIFLIDAKTGDIVHTVRKEIDFGTNIYDGAWAGSGLGELVTTVKKDPTRRAVHQTDTVFYTPSAGVPAMFVGSSIYDGDDVVGILAIQLTGADLNRILTADEKWEEVGLKSSGETYLVGADKLMRSDSRFRVEDQENYLNILRETATPEDTLADIKRKGTSMLLQRVNTDAVNEALIGKTDTRVIKDYRGIEVLSAYQPLVIDGRDFALMAEIDAEEAFAPVRDLSLRMMITTGIVIPLTALMGIWFSAMLMRPAREMRDTARAFLDGKEDVSFQDAASNEWGQLGQQLNKVLDTAKARLSDAKKAEGETKDMISRLMPPAIGERFQGGERNVVSHAPDATTAMFFMLPDPSMNNLDDPAQSTKLYDLLDDKLDEVAVREGVDLLNQAGMHYVAFCGLTAPMENHAERVFRFCEGARDVIATFNREHGTHLIPKVGLSSASMFGALVGSYSTAYEIWGETIHLSSDLAYAAPPGSLYITKHAADLTGRGIKGKAVKVTTQTGEKVDSIALVEFMAETLS